MTNKTDFNFAKISKEQSSELTTIIKETVATDFVSVKNFTIVDLWNFQRRSKTRLKQQVFNFIPLRP